ncbi:MAG: hypothetical protein OXG97_22195 [Candidatus Poribacteria bacterium]|nr:hypothetical protein [Candidatus Poribacteria bacterium]
MKTILGLLIFFFVIILPLYSETSENAIETDIAVIKTDIQNLNEKIDDKFGSLEKRFNDKFGSLEKRFDSLEKNFDRQNTLIIACIAIPMALITLMIAWRSIKDNSLQKQIDELSQVIESQKQQLTERSPQS